MYNKFEALIDEKKTTAYKVSMDTNISQSTLSDWKTGRSTPKIDKLKTLAEYFGVPITYFLED